MGQQMILELLKKKPDRWYSTKEIAEHLGICTSSAQNNLRRLREWNYVDYKKSIINKGATRFFDYRLKSGDMNV